MKPHCSPISTIQSASTPPPSPPIAKMAIVIARAGELVRLPLDDISMLFALLSCDSFETTLAPTLQPCDQPGSHSRFYAIPARWVGNNVGAIKRRTQTRRMRHLSAQTASHA